MRQPLFKLLAAFCVAAVLLVVVVLVITLSQPVPPPLPLPNPNGYDDFVAAGKMIPADAPDYRSMTTNELGVYVLQNAPACERARLGLTRSCRVPPEYSPEIQTNIQNLGVLKRLGLVFAAEGALAESENRTNDAAKSYLTAIRLGQESGRGGVIIDSLVSIAIEAVGDSHLENMISSLDAHECRELACALESAETNRESTATVLQNEREWTRRTWGFKGEIVRLVTFRSIRQTEKRWASRALAQQVRSRALIVKLATRAYQLEKGQPPPTVASLVPEYLKAIPPAFGATVGSPMH